MLVLQMNSIRKLKMISRIGLKQIRKNKIEDTGKKKEEENDEKIR